MSTVYIPRADVVTFSGFSSRDSCFDTLSQLGETTVKTMKMSQNIFQNKSGLGAPAFYRVEQTQQDAVRYRLNHLTWYVWRAAGQLSEEGEEEEEEEEVRGLGLSMFTVFPLHCCCCWETHQGRGETAPESFSL